MNTSLNHRTRGASSLPGDQGGSPQSRSLLRCPSEKTDTKSLLIECWSSSNFLSQGDIEQLCTLPCRHVVRHSRDIDMVSIPSGPFLLLATLEDGMHMHKTHIHACAHSLHMYAHAHTHNTHMHTWDTWGLEEDGLRIPSALADIGHRSQQESTRWLLGGRDKAMCLSWAHYCRQIPIYSAGVKVAMLPTKGTMGHLFFNSEVRKRVC